MNDFLIFGAVLGQSDCGDEILGCYHQHWKITQENLVTGYLMYIEDYEPSAGQISPFHEFDSSAGGAINQQLFSAVTPSITYLSSYYGEWPSPA